MKGVKDERGNGKEEKGMEERKGESKAIGR